MQTRLVLLVASLFASGCTVVTTEPLSDPLTAKVDESMYGHWVQTTVTNGQKTEQHVFIGRHAVAGNPKSIMELVYVDWNANDNQVGASHKIYFTTTRIGETTYLNAFDLKHEKPQLVQSGESKGQTPPPPLELVERGSYKKWTENEDRCCRIARYVCDGKTLKIWDAKDETLLKLGKDKQLDMKEGIVTVESLKKYLEQSGGEKLFDQELLQSTKAP